ncbi:MAG: heavy metal-binding domain-containing protein, partial [Candidatus Rokuibacteriota bacterium]
MKETRESHGQHPTDRPSLPLLRTATATDPVCGMTVDPAHAAGSTTYLGTIYFFCTPGCLERFRANPAAYVTATRPAPAAIPSGAVWTCPMHPDVVRNGPGSCPICGMALEPRVPTLEEGENPELRDMTRRFWIGLGLTVPILVLMLDEVLPGRPLHGALPAWLVTWGQLVLATPVVWWAGWPFFARGWASVVNRSPSMFT